MNPEDLKRQMAAEILARRQATQHQAAQSSYDKITASEIYCPNCKQAMPVREKQLLVLSDGDVVDFVCTACSTSLGTRRG